MRINLFLRLIILVFIGSIWTQSNSIKILSIDVEGNKRLTAEDIMRNAQLFEGMNIDGDDIQKGIKRLWNLDRFGNIQIFITEEEIDGVHLLIQVIEFPILDQIIFSGKKRKSESTLNDKIDLQLGQILSDYDIYTAMSALKSFYKSKHYHNVEIDTIITSGSIDFSQNVEFVINTGKKLKIKGLKINGNEAISDFWVKRQLKGIKPRKFYFPWSGGWDPDKLIEAKKNLMNYYYNKGYRDFYIIDDRITENDKGDGFIIEIDLYEGPQYHINSITWEGNNVHSEEELEDQLGFKVGDLFITDKFNMAVSEKVSPLYMDKGYFYFQIQPEIKPVGEDQLDIHFKIVENDIVHIRKIIISGNEKTYENVIRRELMTFPGDVFSRKKLLESYRDIYMLNFFNNVIPNVIPVDEDEIDITFEVAEKESGTANFSMGYNGQYGLTGGGGFQFPNFLGRGQTLSLSYNRGLSGGSQNTSGYNYNQMTSSSNISTYQSFSLSFTDPWVFDTPNLIGFSFFYTEKGQGQSNYSYLPFDVRSIGGSAKWGRRFKWPDPYFRGTWMTRTSNNTYFTSIKSDLVDYFGESNEPLIEEENGQYLFKTSGVSFTQVIRRDNRNHPEFPTNGSEFTWTSTFSGSFLGGDEDYHKHVFEFKWFTPLMRKFAMHQTIKLGALKELPVAEGQRSVISPSARFMLGGVGIPYGEMLRGYPDNSIGYTGYQRGGDLILKYSMEFRILLSEAPTIYVLTFAEAGNVWTNFDNIDPFDLKRSVGIGFRMHMPMLGMMGYDIGYGFDKKLSDPNDSPLEYHIIFGMPF